MACAKESTQLRRLLLLTVVALAMELALLPGIIFKLLAVSATWSVPLQLLVLFLPRFAVMLALVMMFGPFGWSLQFAGFLAAYTALVIARFYQSEAFVDWSSVIAASRATLSYAAGIVGAVLAFLLGRKAPATGVGARAL